MSDEMEKLDAMLEAQWPFALVNDPVAIRWSIRLLERKMAMLGLEVL